MNEIDLNEEGIFRIEGIFMKRCPDFEI